MTNANRYVRSLLKQQGIEIPADFEEIFNQYATSAEIISNVNSILQLQKKMTKDWQLIARREEIDRQLIAFPNGIVGKSYQTHFDFDQYGLSDVSSYSLTGFEESGLDYDPESKMIKGIPINNGDIILDFQYNFTGEPDDAAPNHKKVTIIINPDPKSLWKNLPSDKADRFWKPDNVAESSTFLDKKLVAVSKRGRSHANKGDFRDDHFAFKELTSGWGIIALSDGAGSAEFSRQGSLLACEAVIDYFESNFNSDEVQLLDSAITAYSSTPEIKNKLKDIAFPHLSNAAEHAYKTIERFALENNSTLSDFHSTLAFALVKKFKDGYAFLSFGVGDCPMVIVKNLPTSVVPLNVLDVGEYGGGTRFITMPEIFKEENLSNRCNFALVPDFQYFVLMSDGIFDPKFEVEANLSKPAKWTTFFMDLKGNNAEETSVNFENDPKNIAEELSLWMDFWSAGNHDDRTLMLLF